MLVSEATLESYEKVFIALGIIDVYARDVLFQGVLKRQLLFERIIQQTVKQPTLIIIFNTLQFARFVRAAHW